MNITLEKSPEGLNEFGRQKLYRTGYREVGEERIYLLQIENDKGAVELQPIPRPEGFYYLLVMVRMLNRKGYGKGRRL